MKLRYPLCIAMILCMTTLPSLAQPTSPEAPATQPATPVHPAMDDVLLPELAFDGDPLDVVIDHLREKVKGFNAVVVRDPGAADNYPILSHVRLRDVSLGQFVDFIQNSYPGVQVNRIDGRAGPLYVIHVNGGPAPVVPGGPMGPGGAPMIPGPDPNQPTVNVYKLSNIIAALAISKPNAKNPADRAKEAMDDVLSLVQAALQQAGAEGEAVLKVHEPTQVLMFKGPPRKNEIVREVLETLQPNPQDEQSKFRSQLERVEAERSRDTQRLNEAMREVDEARNEAATRRHEVEELKVKIAVLEAELAQAQKSAPKPKE